MRLEQISDTGQSVAMALIGVDKALATQVQERLEEAGLLEPPADGIFGPVSLWAIGEFFRLTGQTGKKAIDREAARALLSAEIAELLLVKIDPSTLAGRIVHACRSAGHALTRHPECVNIIYVEGIELDGTPNTDAPNEFNDVRLALRINDAGTPDIVEAWDATSEPGKHHTVIERLDPRGAARIAFGQFKAWSVGTHMAGRPSAHEALVQTSPIRVHRDLNQDFERTGDEVFEGLFGINQHWGFDMPKSDIGTASAGCLVGRTKSGHRAFIKICKSDPRFIASSGYRFSTTVLPASAISGD